MTALAAARLGYRCHVFTDERDSPAEQVCAAATIAEFTDVTRSRSSPPASMFDLEFENVPAERFATSPASNRFCLGPRSRDRTGSTSREGFPPLYRRRDQPRTGKFPIRLRCSAQCAILVIPRY